MTGSPRESGVGQFGHSRTGEIFRKLFGDRYGLVLFLGAMVFFGLYWRLDVFMTDSLTFVNGLGALADGHVGVTTPVIGSTIDTMGMKVANGQAVAQNYGQLILALPILLTLRALETVGNLHVVLVAFWHLLLLGFIYSCGRLLGRERLTALAGSLLVLGSFGVNLVLARQLPDFAIYVASLGILSMLAAAASALVCYRLLARMHERRIGLLAGSALAVASPVAFWAPIAKRHVFTGLTVLVVLYGFYRSRRVGKDETVGPLRAADAFRGMAYAAVGLYAWILAGEAVVMVFALAVVDVATDRRRNPSSYAVAGAIFAVSLVPVLVTNTLVSGDPFTPPGLLPNYVAVGGEAVTPPASPSGGIGGGLESGIVRVSDFFVDGVLTLATDFDGTLRTYVRSEPLSAAQLEAVGRRVRFAGVNLSYLESMPFAAGLLSLVVLCAGRLRAGVRQLVAPVSATDALALALVGTFAVIHAPEHPRFVQFTQRYLFPLFALAVYGLVRLQHTRGSLRDHWRLGVWTWVGTVLVGGQLFLAYVLTQDLSVSEAVQLHGILNLALGGFVAAALSLTVLDPNRDRPAAVSLGLAAGAVTVFVLLAGILYFPIGRFALPVVQALADLVAAA